MENCLDNSFSPKSIYFVSLASFIADLIGPLVLKAEYYLSDTPSCNVASRET